MAPLVHAGWVVGLVLWVITPASAATQKEIDAAVQKGTEFLKARYKNARPGVVVDAGNNGIGPTALAGIALIEAKTPANDAALQAIAASVRDAAYRETKTYSVALALIFLDRLENPADVPLIQVLAVRLLAGQNAQGGWGYDCTEAVPPADEQRLRAVLMKGNQLVGGDGLAPPAVKPSPPSKEASPAKPAAGGKLHAEVEKYAAALWANRVGTRGDDNSNTQFAVMGVWISRKHGVPVEAALDLIEKRFLASQDQTGGWSYSGGFGMAGMNSPSMTCAGLLGLSTAVARREERRLKHDSQPKEKEPAPKGPKSTDPFFNPPPRTDKDKPAGKKPADAKPASDTRDLAVRAGMANLGATLNAGVQAGGLLANGSGRQGDRDLYFLWSLERVGVIFGVDKIGGVDWYAHGADAIVRAQSPDGSWGGASYGAEPGAAFAILFLVRANIARDLSSKVQKETGSTELRAGTGPGATEAAPVPKPPEATVVPGGNPGLLPKPLPAPVEAGAVKLAAELVKVADADWSKALDHTRDAKGPDYTQALVLATHQLAGDRKKQAREALAERLTRMTAETLHGMMKADDPELRRGAVLAGAMKDDKTHVPHLIDRLTDDEDLVVRAAKAGLKSLTGQDFGPAAGATKDQRKTAAEAWRVWWANRK